jgi:hypothetical protein
MITNERIMRKLTRSILFVGLLGSTCTTSAYAELIGSSNDVARKGLESVAGGLNALAVGVALAGLFIAIGLVIGKRRSNR